MRLNGEKKAFYADPLFLLALFGLALRLAFAFFLGERLYQADEGGYSSLAAGLAGWGVYGSRGAPLVGAPGAPLFFAPFYALGGVAGARLAQAFLSAATVWVIGRFAGRVSGSSRCGLLAAAAAALYPFFIYYSGMLLSETLYVAASFAGLWACVESVRGGGRTSWLAAAAGLSWAVAGLTRIEGVAVALGLGLFLSVLAFFGRYEKGALLLAAAVWAFPLIGWAARNKAVSGVYALDLHGGMTLLHGTMFYDIDQEDTRFSRQAFELTPLYAEGKKLDEASRDKLYFRAGLRFMRENPAATLRHWTQKAVAFWRFYPRTDKAYPDDAAAKPGLGASRRFLVLLSLLFEPVLILLGAAGAWRLRGRLAELAPLYWMVAATFAVHVVVVGQMRYRLPVMPVLMVFACSLFAREEP